MAKEKKNNVLVKTLNKVKSISNTIDVIVQLGYIAYLILCIYLIKGNMIANYIFLSVSVLYLIYHCLTYKKWMEGDKSIHRKQLKKGIKFLKKLVNIAVIVFAIIEVSDSGGDVDIFQIVSATLMIIGFLLSLLFEALVASLKRKVDKITKSMKTKVNSFKDDFSNMKNKATSLFKTNKNANVIEVEMDE